MPLLRRILRQNGKSACPEVIRSITLAAGYRWRKARVVLTSTDPTYSDKLQRIHSILSNLKSDEVFFSIDEYGPIAVKMYGGRKLVSSGERPVVPQWQKSRGSLIISAALELSTNQITHFYSKKKNTDEMVKMMKVLIAKYGDRRKIYLSWDAASWHISKQLNQRIEEHNSNLGVGGVVVETAPLPSGAQFLNVIESVFSGMSRAIIQNSNYPSLDDAKSAIDRHFEERND
jgi:DDE superfamily endonuclease